VDYASSTCGQFNFADDGFCDDENNNAGCNWDGGDCCGPKVKTDFCEECQCLDCEFEMADDCVDSATAVCGEPSWQGDNICDDSNNNAGCSWDGGDCCSDSSSFLFCDDCICRDCTSDVVGSYKATGGDDCVAAFSSTCASKSFQGDGFCDDANNNGGCSWDGGDCCGAEVSLAFCSECECLDCTYIAPGDDCVDVALGVCSKKSWKGDGTCDDGNNNAGCDWDGGDCCDDSSNFEYCGACECLDCTVECAGKCQQQKWQGDGYCDDGNNICGCDWDGGDCCGDNNSVEFCAKCECLDPTFVA